jgi:hypothetical protein
MVGKSYKTDLVIIGAGPVGLFSIFQAGMLKMSCHVVDTLEFVGGQCTALYPEKPIYDIPAHPQILASDLIANLQNQAEPFSPFYHLGQRVERLKKLPNGNFLATTSLNNEIEAKAVIIASGCGAFGPNRPPIPDIEKYEGKSVFYSVNSKENFTYLIVSVVTTLLVNSVYMSIEFFNHWRKTLVEKEEFKRTSLSAEFEALKNQVNPHFLFNSLNTLSSLIDENPVQANEFVQKLSSVYRYVLTHRDKETVLLQDEVEFIKSYIFLNKIRFGENLNIHINLNEACLQLNIPTLTLQMLVENAIKHNVISANKPLTVYINCDKEYIEVTNNLQAKLMTVESSGIGLSNIVERYKYLTTKQVFINKTETNFSVKVPLV